MRKFIEHNPIGKTEVDAVKKVVKTGKLSGFYAQDISKL